MIRLIVEKSSTIKIFMFLFNSTSSSLKRDHNRTAPFNQFGLLRIQPVGASFPTGHLKSPKIPRPPPDNTDSNPTPQP
ncbi:hypothetical protein, partial [Pseudomonas helleri]|uniref:hypothetical protein n=1 Tax=Pseudomonas helleri TaxID=1608996 RepID=UPI003FD2CBB6